MTKKNTSMTKKTNINKFKTRKSQISPLNAHYFSHFIYQMRTCGTFSCIMFKN